MTHKLQTTGLNKMVMTCLTILSLTTIMLSSCTKKKSDNEAAKFVGTYTGTASCSSGTAVITLSGSGNTVTLPGTAGSAACQKNITITLTAAGNSLSGAETFTDLCGNPISMSFAGSLSGNTLTFSISASGAGSSGSCTFTGAK